MKYRKKPVEIEAEQYQGVLVKGMCNSTSCYLKGHNHANHHVHTIHNNQLVLLEKGDWIIAEPDGEHYYPCKPDIFEQTYDKV